MSPGRSVDLRTAPVVAISAAAIALYGFDGGAYDVVIRQQFAIVILWVLALGFAFGLLPRGAFGLRQWLPVLSLFLLAVWTAISLRWTQSDERTFLELARVVHHVGLLALVVAALDKRTWRSALIGIAAGGIAVCVGGLVSRLTLSGVDGGSASAAFSGRRLSDPLNYWNAVGSWAAMTAVLLLALSAHVKETILRVVAMAAMPAVLVTGYLAYSRGFYGAVVLGAVVVVLSGRNRWLAALHASIALAGGGFAVLVVRHSHDIAEGTSSTGAGRVVVVLVIAGLVAGGLAAALSKLGGDRWRLNPRTGRRSAALLAAVAVIGAVILALAFGSKAVDQFRDPVLKRSDDPSARLTSLNGTRNVIWSSAIQAFKDHPVNGIGPGTFEFWWSQEGRNTEFVRDAHSLPLEALAELGLVGFALLLAFVASTIAVLIQARRKARSTAGAGAIAGAAGVFIAYLVTASIDWMWESTAVTVFALAAVGCAAASLRVSRERLAVPWRAAVAVLAVLALLIELPTVVMTSNLRKSQAAARAGNIEKALSLVDDAQAAEPWAASPYIQHGLLAEAADDLPTALKDLLRAQSLEPTNWRIPFVLARVYAEAGQPQDALRSYERARQLRPRSIVFRAKKTP
jgi:O-antigen ligase